MSGKKRNGQNTRLSSYAKAVIPKGAIIQFVFSEDIDNDGIKEAIIGISLFSPFPPDSGILIIKRNEKSFEHMWLSLPDKQSGALQSGLLDNAFVADTDKDGIPELVVSRVLSHEHDIDIIVYDWINGEFQPVWHSERSFFHGSIEVADVDGDGSMEILVECGTMADSELMSVQDVCYHVREAYVYKWDGSGYLPSEYQVRMPYISYNISVEFLKAIWRSDYPVAYEMVIMPGFLGVAGLDDSSLAAFKTYMERKVRPNLLRNLEKGKLVPSEPYDTCCRFTGPEDSFTIELCSINNGMFISNLSITKKIS